MNWRLLRFVLVGVLAAAAGSEGPEALGQTRAAHIGYVYPAGGQRGTTVEVFLGGQFLDGASAAHFTAFGIKATVVDHFKPLTQAQFARLREELDELLSRRAAALKAQRNPAQQSKREANAEKKDASSDKKTNGDSAKAGPLPAGRPVGKASPLRRTGPQSAFRSEAPLHSKTRARTWPAVPWRC